MPDPSLQYQYTPPHGHNLSIYIIFGHSVLRKRYLRLPLCIPAMLYHQCLLPPVVYETVIEEGSYRNKLLGRSIEQRRRWTVLPLPELIHKVPGYRVSHHRCHGNVAFPPRRGEPISKVIIFNVFVASSSGLSCPHEYCNALLASSG